MGIKSFMSLSSESSFVYKNVTLFSFIHFISCYFNDLINHIQCFVVFFGVFGGPLDILSCHQQMVTVWFLLFQYVYLWYIFLVWLHSRVPRGLCWTVVPIVDRSISFSFSFFFLPFFFLSSLPLIFF